MSYILDALKKVEREQESNQLAGTENTFLAKPSKRRQYLRGFLIILLLGLNLLLWIILLWPKPPLTPPVIEFETTIK